jgi:hypothetical protein
MGGEKDPDLRQYRCDGAMSVLQVQPPVINA